MGIWDELRLVAAKLINRKASENHYAVTKTVDSVRLNGGQRLDEPLTEASRRENISRILSNIGKFAVDETIKGVAGGVQVHKIAKDQPVSHASDEYKNKSVFLMLEEMPAKMEKIEDDLSCGVRQQNVVSTQCDNNGLEPLKELSDEPCEVSAPLEAGKKRVFIRSRL